MARLFETSRTRRQTDLSGTWEFVAAADGTDDYVESFPDDADAMAVPSVWNTTPEYFRHHGVGWFRRTFTVPEATLATLTFHGVAHESTVYLDGEQIAAHDCGFTPFGALVDLDAGEHELVVRADSECHGDSLQSGDYYNYGGITREVVLEEVPPVFVDDLRIEYDLDGNSAAVTATLTVRNETGSTATRTVGVEVADAGSTRTVEVPPGGHEAQLALDLPDIERWSIADPTLYTVTARVGEDELRDRIGFREISIDGHDILLNGEPLEIRGVNRHEDHPDWGHAQPRRIQERDLEIIQNAGLNTIRTAHYPAHPRLLDYCDEKGLLVIEEVPNYHWDTEDYDSGTLVDRIERCLADTIDRDRHHPSILAWSVGNECTTSEERVTEVHERLVALAHDADESRPVTYAENLPMQAVQLDLGDFVCVNDYPGWYGDDWPPSGLTIWDGDEWEETLDEIRAEYPDPPIVVTEFGAGGVEGERTFEGQKWSESYQAEIVRESIETFEDREDVAGFSVWQYCDIRTTEDRFHYRPRSKNNKGLVGEYRRPKESYYAITEMLTPGD